MPIHHTQPCRSQPSSQIRSEAKNHAHTRSPHTHCPNHTHTPHTHVLQSNGVRNPKLGSLPRGGSSTSSSSSAGPKHTKKLRSNPSINSQSSKRSKSSSKSNSSQIPTEAQDGEIPMLTQRLEQEEREGVIAKFTFALFFPPIGRS